MNKPQIYLEAGAAMGLGCWKYDSYKYVGSTLRKRGWVLSRV